MENQEYTQEPLKTSDKGFEYLHGIGSVCKIYAKDGSGLVAIVMQKESVDNARRIVACWNTCAGIKTELLELAGADFWQKTDGNFEAIIEENDRLRKEIDRLRSEENEQPISALQIAEYFELEFDGVTGKSTIHKDQVEKIQNKIYRLQLKSDALEKAHSEGNLARLTAERMDAQDEADRLRQQNAELADALKMIWRDCENASGQPETYDAIRQESFAALRKAIAYAECTTPEQEYTGEPDPTDLASDYNEAVEYGNAPTPYDP